MLSPPAPADPLVPSLALAVYIACVGGTGALLNCTVLATLLKSARNGVYAIIIQLAIADLGLIGVCLIQLWFSNAKNWQMGSAACSTYQGFRVFTSTLSTYLIVTIALHTLGTISLEEKAAIKGNRRNIQDEDDEIRTSRHSLVANSDTSTPPRTMNVDYRLTDTSVPVTPPTTFVWGLAISLSIPELVLATVVHVDRDSAQCTSVDTNHQVNMHSLLAVFELFLPITIMCVTGILVIVKLKTKKLLMEVWNSESISALKLSIWLIVTYSVFCIPRSVIFMYQIYSSSTSRSEISPIDLTPKSYEIAMIRLSSGAAYLAATTIRPLLCIFLLPRLKKGILCSNSRQAINNV